MNTPIGTYPCCRAGWSRASNYCFKYVDVSDGSGSKRFVTESLQTCIEYAPGKWVYHSETWATAECQSIQIFGEYAPLEHEHAPLPGGTIWHPGARPSPNEREKPDGEQVESTTREWIAPARVFEHNTLVLRHRSAVHRVAVDGNPVEVSAEYSACNYSLGAHTVELDLDIDGKLRQFQLEVRVVPRLRFLHDAEITGGEGEDGNREIRFQVTLANRTDAVQLVWLFLRELPEGWRGEVENGPLLLLSELERTPIVVSASGVAPTLDEEWPLSFVVDAAVVDGAEPRPVSTTVLVKNVARSGSS